MRLYKSGVISLEEALSNSDSPNNLKLKINLSEGLGSATAPKVEGAKSTQASLSLESITKEEDEPE